MRAADVEIERARMFVTAQRAGAVATAARIQAEATSYPPTIGRGLLIEGRAEMISGSAGAATTLERAVRTLLAAHDDVAAVEAFARHAYVAAVHGEKPIDGTTMIDEIADRLGPEVTGSVEASKEGGARAVVAEEKGALKGAATAGYTGSSNAEANTNYSVQRREVMNNQSKQTVKLRINVVGERAPDPATIQWNQYGPNSYDLTYGKRNR